MFRITKIRRLGPRAAKMMGTPSGKIEFVSEFLKEHFPEDKERAVMPTYLEPWEGKFSPEAEKYPLVMVDAARALLLSYPP